VALNQREAPTEMGKIRHIAIRCEDTDKTAQWLKDALELQIVQRRGSGAIDLTDGDVNITLLPVGLGQAHTLPGQASSTSA